MLPPVRMFTDPPADGGVQSASAVKLFPGFEVVAKNAAYVVPPARPTTTPTATSTRGARSLGRRIDLDLLVRVLLGNGSPDPPELVGAERERRDHQQEQATEPPPDPEQRVADPGNVVDDAPDGSACGDLPGL